MGIGAKHAESEVFLQFNELFKNFNTKALEANIPEMDIESICCQTFLTSENVKKCSTFDNRIKLFWKFKIIPTIHFLYIVKNHPVLLI